ncbi:MAG TPA: hypothetical protein VGO47_10380 [Chlamydiales bacterium]|jgi:hypothetical protein|nr:hypothetical protein [Chlamydiales bacterium]
MTSSSLVDLLAAEIWEDILGYLDKWATSSLSMACHRLHIFIAPYLFREVTFKASTIRENGTLEDAISRLLYITRRITFIRERPDLLECIRSITVQNWLVNYKLRTILGEPIAGNSGEACIARFALGTEAYALLVQLINESPRLANLTFIEEMDRYHYYWGVPKHVSDYVGFSRVVLQFQIPRNAPRPLEFDIPRIIKYRYSNSNYDILQMPYFMELIQKNNFPIVTATLTKHLLSKLSDFPGRLSALEELTVHDLGDQSFPDDSVISTAVLKILKDLPHLRSLHMCTLDRQGNIKVPEDLVLNLTSLSGQLKWAESVSHGRPISELAIFDFKTPSSEYLASLQSIFKFSTGTITRLDLRTVRATKLLEFLPQVVGLFCNVVELVIAFPDPIRGPSGFWVTFPPR